MSKEARINGHTHPQPPAEQLLRIAIEETWPTIPIDGIARVGVFTSTTVAGAVLLTGAQLGLPDDATVPDQRLARFVNTVADADRPTIREQFLQQVPGTLLAWWLTIGFPGGARLLLAATPDGVWFDVAATGHDTEAVIGCADRAPDGFDEIVGFVQEMACPVTLQHHTPAAWQADELRMCGCWHPFAEHWLDRTDHPCTQNCGCRSFASTDDALTGRWIRDTPAALGALGLDGSCATADHHTGPDGRRWHWVPDFLTRAGH
ncbi:hypothetical protein NUM_07370 [Actinocatenispora comari]|uniref:Uncharacterized protein n=1 Tax=Actinocatenispora comari TaxID=2807577 RepID=A0A8J4A9B0_9ACTN|nr:hypothetical protein NUM_07370 [Actinocatenispora comari]